MQTSPGTALYPNLLSPLKVGRTTLRNRMIMGSMHTRLDMEENGLHKMAVFLAERARGEIALIITGGYAPNTAGLIEPGGSLDLTGLDAVVSRAQGVADIPAAESLGTLDATGTAETFYLPPDFPWIDPATNEWAPYPDLGDYFRIQDTAQWFRVNWFNFWSSIYTSPRWGILANATECEQPPGVTGGAWSL